MTNSSSSLAYVAPTDYALLQCNLPTLQQRKAFWDYEKLRLACWGAAERFFSTLSPKELESVASHRLSLSYLGTPDAFEKKVFEKEITAGERELRNQFWHFVIMLMHGVVPSDIENSADCDAEYAKEVNLCLNESGELIADAVQKRLDYDINYSTSSHFEKHIVNQLRAFAELYLSMGYDKSAKCRVVYDGTGKHGFGYLSVPTYPFSTPAAGGPEYFTLDQWMRNGLTTMTPMRRIGPEFAYHYTPGVEPKLEAVPNTPKKADVAKHMFEIAMAFYNKWPEKCKPRLTYLAIQCIHPSSLPWASNENELITEKEKAVFGRKITSGSCVARALLWKNVLLIAQGCKEPYTTSWYLPHSKLVKSNAKALIADGCAPEMMAKLIDFGRGGLSVPVKPNDPLINELEYATLAKWFVSGV